MDPEIMEEKQMLSTGTVDIVPEEELEKKISASRKSGKALKIKLGVDPTAPDLHLGHTVVLRKLRDFQRAGHDVTLLIGDFTARIGDPSGRNALRPPLTGDEIDRNARTYSEQAFKILDRKKTAIRYNSEWLSKLSFEDVIRLASRFMLARTLERDDFAKRYAEGRPIALHELLYPVMQAYDSVMLESDVELGGTDQTFNLLAGRQLQEAMGQDPQVCMMLPILEGTDGVRRMGKSLGNYIGISEPAEEIFGKTMSIPDALMIKWFRLLTDLPLAEIEGLEAGLADGSLHPGELKRRLGRTIVALYYDDASASEAEAHFDRLHKPGAAQARGGGSAEPWAPEGTASVPLAASDLEEGVIWLPKLLVHCGLAASNREARTLIEGGGVRIDGEIVTDSGGKISPRQGMLLQVGKRKFARLDLS